MSDLLPIDTAAQTVAAGLDVWRAWGTYSDQKYAIEMGTATGGPNGDGRYPITNRAGATQLVSGPARLEAIAAAGGVGNVKLTELASMLAGAAGAALVGTEQGTDLQTVLKSIAAALTFSCLATAIPATAVPANVTSFTVSGFSAKNLGRAHWVEADVGETLDPILQGVSWFSDLNGRRFKFSPAERVTLTRLGVLPKNYAGGTADQSPRINLAIYYNETVRFRSTIDLEGFTYQCTTKVKINPTLSSFIGLSAKLDFSSFVSYDPNTQPNLLPWGSLNTATGFTLGTVPGRGAEWALNTSTKTLARPTITSATFSDCGGQVDPTLRTGDAIRLTITINKLSSAGPSATYLSVGFFDRGVGVGNSFGGGVFSNNQAITTPTTFTADVIIPTTKDHADGTKSWDRGAWITISTVCNCEIGSVSVSRIPDNRCLSVFTEAGSPQYGAASLPWYGFDVGGPGRFTFAQGIVFESYATSLSSRINGQWINVHDFYVGLNWGTRSYTGGFVFSAFYACTYPVMSSTGTQDAGENISFVQCGFFNSTVGIYNPGNFEFSFHQCSIDYNGRFYEGGGTSKFSQCHFEMGATKLNTDGSQRIPFIVSGNLDITDSYILTTTPLNGATINNTCLFYTNNASSTVRLKNTAGYDWATSSGFLMQGLGTIFSDGLHGGGQLNIPFRLADDDEHRMTGRAGHFEAATLLLDCWATSSSGYRARATSFVTSNSPTGAAATAIKGNGTITGVVGTERCDAGVWAIKFTTATTYNVIRPDYTLAVNGGTIATAAGTVVAINTAGFMTTLTQGSTPFAANDKIVVTVGDQAGKAIYYTDFNGVVTTTAKMALTTADAAVGTQCLEITKTGGGSLTVYLAAPFRPNSRGGMSMQWRYIAPDGSTSTALAYLYCQFFAARLIYGESGVPQVTENQFVGETNPTVTIGTSTAWDTMGPNLNMSESTNGLTPQYTNALIFKLNLSGLPAGAKFRIDELEAYCA